MCALLPLILYPAQRQVFLRQVDHLILLLAVHSHQELGSHLHTLADAHGAEFYVGADVYF